MCIVTCDYWLSQAHSWLTPHSCTVLGWRRGVEWLCLFNFYTEYIMRNAGLDEAEGGIKIAGRNINISDMHMTPPLWQKVKKN